MINTLVAQGLSEYGAAIRGDWSELDGRSVRHQLDYLAGLLTTPEPWPTIEQIRSALGICPAGGGHWAQYCEDSFVTCGAAETPQPTEETRVH